MLDKTHCSEDTSPNASFVQFKLYAKLDAYCTAEVKISCEATQDPFLIGKDFLENYENSTSNVPEFDEAEFLAIFKEHANMESV
jgi:hypothetical protein